MIRLLSIVAVSSAIFIALENPIPMIRRMSSMLPHDSNRKQDFDQNADRDKNVIRVGLIGASDIAKFAIIWPATKNKNVEVVSIAARDTEKAKTYAKKHNIPHVHNSYEELIQDPNIDAVYIGVITEMHYSLALKAIESRKHALLEKPGVLSMQEAMELQSKAKESNVVVFEAFHWKYHPAAKRVFDIVNSDEIGTLQHIEAVTAMFDPKEFFHPLEDERARIKLLDRWCYLVDEMNYFLNNNDDTYDIQVKDAHMSPSQLQANMTATTNHGKRDATNSKKVVTIRFDAYKDKLEIPKWYITLKGSNGEVTLTNLIFPFIFHSIHYTNYEDSTKRVEYKYDDGKKEGTTFEFQLVEFVKAVQTGVGSDDIITQMLTNSNIYEKIVSFTGQHPFKSW